MVKYTYTDEQKEINKVLKYQDDALKELKPLDKTGLDKAVASSEELLKSLGYSLDGVKPVQKVPAVKTLYVPSWDEICKRAELEIQGDIALEQLFTEEELAENAEAIRLLNHDYNQIYKLDKYDYIVAALAGIVSGATDILLNGIPHSELHGGEKSAPLTDFIRKEFEKKFPPGELENSAISKVPYDAQYNRNTTVNVEGLSAYYHRLLSLGHDPLLGFVVGVMDIMSGRMTTIDKAGKLASQVMEGFSDRKEANIFAALAKQLIHLKSDVTTSMGLPAPLMSLFNFLQIGSIGPEDQTIAEVVQYMYHEGYDFIHFCSLSIPVMITEVIIRLYYTIRRLREGHTLKESVPITTDRIKYPKVATMLFISHSAATAINAGKVYFTKDPLAINYPQWVAFAKYSYSQLKWALIKKPELRDEYVKGKIHEELDQVLINVDATFNQFAENRIVIYGA